MLGRFLGPENGYDAQVKNICAIIGVRRARSVAPERWPQGSREGREGQSGGCAISPKKSRKSLWVLDLKASGGDF